MKQHDLNPRHHNLAALMARMPEREATAIMQRLARRDDITQSLFIDPGLKLLGFWT